MRSASAARSGVRRCGPVPRDLAVHPMAPPASDPRISFGSRACWPSDCDSWPICAKASSPARKARRASAGSRRCVDGEALESSAAFRTDVELGGILYDVAQGHGVPSVWLSSTAPRPRPLVAEWRPPSRTPPHFSPAAPRYAAASLLALEP